MRVPISLLPVGVAFSKLLLRIRACLGVDTGESHVCGEG